jgi:hypothetical protein
MQARWRAAAAEILVDGRAMCGERNDAAHDRKGGPMGRYRFFILMVSMLFISGFIAGCATPLVVDYDYDTTYDFGKLKTYDWLPSPPGNQIEEMAEKRFIQATNTQLAAKGYRQSTESPDVLISLSGIKKTVDAGSTAVGASIGIPVGQRGSVSLGTGRSKPRVKQEGTVMLNFVDRQTNTPVWQGSATAEVQPKTSPEEQQQRINQVMAELLVNFPPKGAKK